MHNDRFGNPEDWITAPLVAAGNRLALRGEESGGMHCGDPLEVEVAPGVWIRGTVELDHGLTLTRLGQTPDKDKSYQGWYLMTGGSAPVLWMTPGMTARRWPGLTWPEPSTPYEGQTWKPEGFGTWRRYHDGQWVTETGA